MLFDVDQASGASSTVLPFPIPNSPGREYVTHMPSCACVVQFDADGVAEVVMCGISLDVFFEH